MKPINKVCSKDDLRPAMNFFQVKNGYVRATDGNMLLKLPVDEVFGRVHIEPIINSDEELYFDAKEWSARKFHTSKMIYRDGLTFTSDKDTIIVAKTIERMTAIGRFPDCDAVVPEESKRLSSISRVGIDFTILHDLCSAFGKVDAREFVYYFYGEDRCILIKHPESEGFGLLMPTSIDKYPQHPFQADQEEEIEN
jgi:hypothetical protein